MTERTVTLTESEVQMVMNELARRDPVISLLMTKLQTLGTLQPVEQEPPK